MDIIDAAQDATEALIQNSLRSRRVLSIPFSGACLSCEEPVEGERRFCDAECRDHWEAEQKRKFGIRVG